MTDFAKALRCVREQMPLVQCITNFVTVNDCANMILASGGSPSMAHDIREVEEAVTGVQALVCNLGAIEDVDAMILAGKQAGRLGKPVVFDPVAVGRTKLRRAAADRLLSEVPFSVIRGNASEIRYLAGQWCRRCCGGFRTFCRRITGEGSRRAFEAYRRDDKP